MEKAQGNYPQQPKPGEEWWLPAHVGGSAPTVEAADAMDERDRTRRRAERNKEA